MLAPVRRLLVILALSLPLTSAVEWVECVGRDSAYAEKASYLDLHGYMLEDPAYFQSMHRPESSYCTPFTWDLKEDGLPPDYLLATRLYFANPLEMQILWENMNESQPAKLYPHPLSLDNEFQTLDLLIARLKTFEEGSQQFSDKAHAQGIGKILNRVVECLREVCEVRSSLLQKGILREILSDTLKPLAAAKKWTLKRSLEEYYAYLVDMISPEQCDFGAGKYQVSFIEEVNSSPASSSKPFVVRVAEVYHPIYNATLRGLILAPADKDIRKFQTDFGQLDYGGYATVVHLNCRSMFECAAAENQLFAAYHRVMAGALSFAPIPLHEASGEQTMLCLGVGGGELISFLLSHHANLRIDAVEIEESIIRLAQRYFHLPTCDGAECRLSITHQDAWTYLEQVVASQRSYDYLLCDLFDARVVVVDETGDSNVPGISFEWNVELMSKALRPLTGLAVLHIHNGPAFSVYWGLINKYFSHAILLVSGGSFIIAASQRGEMMSFEESATGHYSVSSISSVNPCTDFQKMAAAIIKFGKANGYGNQIALGTRYASYCNSSDIDGKGVRQDVIVVPP